MLASCRNDCLTTLAVLSACLLSPVLSLSDTPPDTLGIGRAASAADIARWDIDVGPDGAGLPAGGATARQGEPIYTEKCAGCHGADGARGRDKLAGPLTDARHNTVGNYWPWATTLFDYIRRAMPLAEPGSLTNAEVYALTAYVLYLNTIIPFDQPMNAESLPAVEMPARARFVPDDRRGGPEVR
jgi:cytochrome c